MTRLTAQNVDQLAEALFENGRSHLDLSRVTFLDPYALLFLVLGLRIRRESEDRCEVSWPRSRHVQRWLAAMSLAREVDDFAPAEKPLFPEPSDALQPITRITDEESIPRLIDAFHRRLTERYPLTPTSRGRLTKIMLELFQNIPQHGNPTGEAVDPHGLAAMQDYRESIFLAVADRGVGVRVSLSTREEYADIRDTGALNEIVFNGASRFDDPGRGGELRRIMRLVRNWDGIFAIHSGEAHLIADPDRGEVHDAPFFPGVQIAIQLPREVFGIEQPPVDDIPTNKFN